MTNYKKIVYEAKAVIQKVQAGADIDLVTEKIIDLEGLTEKFKGNDKEVIISTGYWMASLVDHSDFFITDSMFSLVFNMLDRLAACGTFTETVYDEEVFSVYDRISELITETLHGAREYFYEEEYNDCQEGEEGYEQACQLKADIKRAKETQEIIEAIYNDYVHGVIDALLAIYCMYKHFFNFER